MTVAKNGSIFDYRLARLRKLSGFVGTPKFDGVPLLVNSLPKAGTNLFEVVLLELGYKRGLHRCIVRDNLKSAKPRPAKGRFYLCHVPDQTFFQRKRDFKSIFLSRDIWSCCTSYINYMYIDKKHPVSNFIVRSNNLEESIFKLLLTSENPNGISLVEEYLKFYEANLDTYNLKINFEDLRNLEEHVIADIANFFDISSDMVTSSLVKALSAATPTKNQGRISLFQKINREAVVSMEQQVRHILHNQISGLANVDKRKS